MSYKATMEIFGDTLEVIWDGTVWMSPHNRQQHSTSREAMEAELRVYYRACGDDPDDLENSTAITDHLECM